MWNCLKKEIGLAQIVDNDDDDNDTMKDGQDDSNDENINTADESRGGILYTFQTIPSRRRQRNSVQESSRVIANPQSEQKSFKRLLTEEISRTILIILTEKLSEFN